jgi:hypothetical protein
MRNRHTPETQDRGQSPESPLFRLIRRTAPIRAAVTASQHPYDDQAAEKGLIAIQGLTSLTEAELIWSLCSDLGVRALGWLNLRTNLGP